MWRLRVLAEASSRREWPFYPGHSRTFSGSVLPSRALLVDLLLIHSFYGGISASVLASVESEGMDSHSVHRGEGGVHQHLKRFHAAINAGTFG